MKIASIAVSVLLAGGLGLCASSMAHAQSATSSSERDRTAQPPRQTREASSHAVKKNADARNTRDDTSGATEGTDSTTASTSGSTSESTSGSTSSGSTTDTTSGTSSAGVEVEDTLLSTRVKAALLADPDVQDDGIDVKAEHGEIILSGSIANEDQLSRALEVAGGVDGVQGVQNNLRIGN